jgi:hypothetical protein
MIADTLEYSHSSLVSQDLPLLSHVTNTLPTTFDATDPGEITSPNDASVPQVGVTASDSPLDVVLPESLSADVPTIGDGSPEAIDAVAPPAAWLKAKDEALIATLAVAGEPGGSTRPRPKDNDQQTSNNRNTSQQTTGRKNSPTKEKDVSKKEETNSYGKASSAGARDKAERDENRQDRKTPSGKAQGKQNEAVNTANQKANPGTGPGTGSSFRPAKAAFGGSRGWQPPQGIDWGKVGAAVAAAGKAIADAAKAVGPAAGKIVGGVVGAVIIGTQAADGELPEYLMTEEDKAAQTPEQAESEANKNSNTSSTNNTQSDAATPSTPEQTIGQQIANGHAWDKHVEKKNEYPGMFNDRGEFGKFIDGIVENPTESKELLRDRNAYWDDTTGTVVITDPNSSDGGTAFRPDKGKDYYDNNLK